MNKKTVFRIQKMDCPSEERLIRMRLDETHGIHQLDFQIPSRQMTAIHDCDPEIILKALEPLNFGASILDTSETTETINTVNNEAEETSLLKKLFAINAIMFFIEFLWGILAESMGLISDSLDMLADSGVYLVSLFAVGKALSVKKRSALTNGILQFIIGTGIIIETVRRFMNGSEPRPEYMILVSVVALMANVYCLILLSRHKEGEVHLKASYICSSSDVMANTGVILAGVLVFLTQSRYPDLIIGIIVTFIVLRGSYSILKIAR